MPCSSALHSAVARRWNRLTGREGAIRLEDCSDAGEKGELPFFLTGEQAEEEGYTSAHLLGECVLASLWNAFCLAYLHYPSRQAAPSPSFVYALLGLAAVPLMIGTSAGAAALFGESRSDEEWRERTGKAKKTAVWLGLIACIAAVWPILAFVMSGENVWLQRHLALTTAVVQMLLVKLGIQRSCSEEAADDLVDDDRPPDYFDDEKPEAVLTVREFLLEAHRAEKQPLPSAASDIEEEVVVQDKQAKMQQRRDAIREERLRIRSFSV
ncbi:hypothetical protein JCM10213_000970 [Rhodosporidiobolus nylandii]